VRTRGCGGGRRAGGEERFVAVALAGRYDDVTLLPVGVLAARWPALWRQRSYDHLGKLLTYCAGTNADVVIWIAETLNEEHLAALEWLNKSTVQGVGFFASSSNC
jgi:hypothetical protein